MNYIIVFFISFSVTAISTPFLINLFNKKGIIDKPEERKIHLKEIPRMGGIIIYPIVILMLLIFYKDLNSIRFFILSSITILICGIFDDIIGIGWKAKFIIQFVAVLFLMIYFLPMFNYIRIFSISIPYYIGILVLILYLLGTINSINLMDGLDGLVSGYSILIMLAVVYLARSTNNELVLLLSISVLGTLLAFLKYNSFPAQIFLGDTGALILGLILVFSVLNISIDVNTSTLRLTFPVMILSVPIMDTLRVMVIRILHKKNPFLADKNHLHHIIISLNIKHKTTVFLIHVLSMGFIVTALLYQTTRNNMFIGMFWLLGIIFLLFKPLLKQYLIYHNSIRNKTNKILEFRRLLIPYFIKVLIPISVIIFTLILITAIKIIKPDDFRIIELFLLIGIILLFIAGVHHIKNKKIAYIYVFFNFIFIFFTSKYFISLPLDLLSKPLFPQSYLNYSIVFFFILVLFFVLLRDKLQEVGNIFLTGIDLMLVSITIMLFILQQFSPYSLAAITLSIFYSLILYFWFKIVHIYMQRTSIVIFYLLFIVNLITLIVSI